MSFEPLRYHCPQCGYDLRGQTVDRCPECGFHYDLPALREVGWRAFYARYDPYLTAAKILAAAGILSLGALFCPATPGSMPLIFLTGIIVLPSSRVAESWILGSLPRDMRDLEWLSRQMLCALIGVGVLFMFTGGRRGHIFIAPLWFGAVGAVILGLAFLVAGYTTQEDREFAVTPVRQRLLDRAGQAAWTLATLDVVILSAAMITHL